MKDTLKIGSLGSDTRALQTAFNTLGMNLATDGVFGEMTEVAVRDFQAKRGLEPDGIVGPKTWEAIDQALANHAYVLAHPPAVDHASKLEEAGRKAVERALAYWQQDIYDPRRDDVSDAAKVNKAHIDDFIRKGLGWTWEPTYAGDGAFEWCGAFAAMCWTDVKPELRKLYFASTYRLDRYARYQSFNGETNAGSGRLIATLDETSTALPFEPRPGDILLIGPKGYGQHICVVESFDKETKMFNTIEGNGSGRLSRGSLMPGRQGVVRGSRRLGANVGGSWCARRLIRPAAEDLT